MMARLFKYIKIISWILSGLIFLSFLGYILWLSSFRTIMMSFTGLMFLPQIFWVGYYWVILIVFLIILVFFIFLRKNQVWTNYTFLAILFSIIIWLIIPFLGDSSVTPVIKRGEISRLTYNLKRTYNPAIRFKQISENMLEGGCKYWLEGWSEDGQYLEVSERSYGSCQCLDSDTFIIDIKTKQNIRNPNVSFIARTDNKRQISLLDDYLISNDNYIIYDILPSPKAQNYAVILGKNSLTGPHEIFIFKLEETF